MRVSLQQVHGAPWQPKCEVTTLSMTSPSSITCTEQDGDYEDLLCRCSEEVL